MDQWFVINDLHEFTEKTRAIVYNSFGNSTNESDIDSLIDSVNECDQQDLDHVLSHNESILIIKQIAKKQKNKKNSNIRYVISEELFAKVVEDLNARMISNILNSLVQKGLVDSAYDNESNDFIFWIKNDNEKGQS